jgi:hypothetical protein
MYDKDDEYINKNYYKLFIRAEEQANRIDSNIQDIARDYDMTYEEMKNEISKIGKGVEFYDDTNILDLITILNSDQTDLSREELLSYIKSQPSVIDIEIPEKSSNGGVKFSKVITANGDIDFLAISDLLKQSDSYGLDEGNEALKRYCEEVESFKKRNGNCHEFSVKALKVFSKYFNQKTKIVTGNVSYYVPENKYVHSWLEFDLAGKKCALDSTKNIITDRDTYYRLLHIGDKDIYSIIESDDIINDEAQYGEFINELDYKTYLTTRDEIIRDLEKNKQLFDRQNNDSSEVR